jgi:hypothetical protein
MLRHHGTFTKTAAAVVAAAAVASFPAPADAASKGTSLTLDVPGQAVTQGADVQLGGRLTDGKQKLGTRVVTLAFRKNGHRSYATVSTVRTAADGKYHFRVAARNTGSWKVSYAGDKAHRAASTSKSVDVVVSAPRLIGAYTGKPVFDLPYPDSSPASSWGSGTVDPRIDYTVTWAFTCPDKASRGWVLYWIDGNDIVDISDPHDGDSSSGVFHGHDGWDGAARDAWQWSRRFKADAFGPDASACSISVKLYSGTTKVRV